MHMLYNSDSFVVVRFDLGDTPAQRPPAGRGGYEIVDKFAQREIFLHGDVARGFHQAVMALAETEPSEEAMDDFIAAYCTLAQQPVALH